MPDLLEDPDGAPYPEPVQRLWDAIGEAAGARGRGLDAEDVVAALESVADHHRAEVERWKRAEAAQTNLVRVMFDALGGDPVRDTADVLAASVRARAEAAEATIQRVRAIRDDLASLPGSWVGPWVHSYNVLDALNGALDGGPDTEEADRG